MSGMSFTEILFWLFLLSLLYSYVGYGILVALLIRLGFGRKPGLEDGRTADTRPRLFFVILAYNEEEVIAAKLMNSLSLEYPADRLRICVNADGSTDATARIAAAHEGVLVLHQPERLGKAAAMNRAVQHAGDADILVFSDANTHLGKDALLLLARHYADGRVGAVSGEKKVSPGGAGNLQAVGESLYWRYESAMKALDSRFHTLVGAAGELLSIRRELYRTIPPDTILDDLHLSLEVCLQGRVVEYEPGAVALEDASTTISQEWERKVRIGAGAYQTLARFPALMLPWPDLRLWIQFVSRRFLRWVLCPMAVPALLVLNLLLASGAGPHREIYQVLLVLQVIFHVLALSGAMLPSVRHPLARVFQLPFYFLFMHYALWAGFFRWLRGGQSAAWEKADRPGRSI